MFSQYISRARTVWFWWKILILWYLHLNGRTREERKKNEFVADTHWLILFTLSTRSIHRHNFVWHFISLFWLVTVCVRSYFSFALIHHPIQFKKMNTSETNNTTREKKTDRFLHIAHNKKKKKKTITEYVWVFFLFIRRSPSVSLLRQLRISCLCVWNSSHSKLMSMLSLFVLIDYWPRACDVHFHRRRRRHRRSRCRSCCCRCRANHVHILIACIRSWILRLERPTKLTSDYGIESFV